MSVAQQAQTDSVSYEDLYRRWEDGNWSAMALDLSEDRAGWEAQTEIQRKSGLWTYSMFFYGEDSVTDNLSPYIDAAPKEEQKYFLASQQVDEARHAVFFHRFFKEVIGAGDAIGATLAYTEPQLNWGYRKAFDRLDQMADELRADRSLPKFAQAIALYHMVVEAALAQPGQHFIEDYFVKSGTMPGFSEGMVHVSRDEQRHIAFGVKALADAFKESAECKAAVDELMREVMPWAMSVFVPPNWDMRYAEAYGFTLEEIFAFGMRSVEAKWRAAGYPVEEMPPGVYPLDLSLSYEERARDAIAMLHAGVIGEPTEQADSSPEIQKLYFSTVARSVQTDAVNGKPFTVQWRFEDADPWHLVVDNGSSRAEPGEVSAANVTLEASWRDFIALSSGEVTPGRALLNRQVRMRGGPLDLMRFRRLLPGSKARAE